MSPELAGAIEALLSFAAGYAIGSIPASPLIGRAAGVDVLAAGDRNPGAANVWKLAGPRAGLAALLADMAKGLVPALALATVVEWGAGWAAALGAIVGHGWPALGRYPGGRAVATFAGALIGLAPIAGAVGAAIVIAVALVVRAVGGPARVAAITAGIGSFPLLFVVAGGDLTGLGAVMVLYVVAGVRYVTGGARR